MTSNFFDTNDYFIDERNIFRECYQIFNDRRESIGRIKQKISLRQKLLRLIIDKSLLPFCLEIRSANGGLEASISRGGIYLFSDIIIQDARGKKVGKIKQNFNFFKPEFKILNISDDVIAEISGNWKTWSFLVNDASENYIGSIDKKWIGSIRNALRSSSNRYNVNIDTNYSSKEEKIAILSGAIVINMLLFISKKNTIIKNSIYKDLE